MKNIGDKKQLLNKNIICLIEYKHELGLCDKVNNFSMPKIWQSTNILKKFIWVFFEKQTPKHDSQSAICPQSEYARKYIIGQNWASPMWLPQQSQDQLSVCLVSLF